jgi:hypothetical protein
MLPSAPPLPDDEDEDEDDSRFKIRVGYPFVPMFSDFRHGVGLGTHICSVGPFVDYPLWLIFEQRGCYPWLSSVLNKDQAYF